MHPNIHSRTLTITKTQKQPKCLSTDEWIHIYNGILLSHKKRLKLPLAATWMDLEIVILSELLQRMVITI